MPQRPGSGETPTPPPQYTAHSHLGSPVGNDTLEPIPSPDELLLQQCLDSADGERLAVLARLCREHPDRATSLRELFALLDRFGLAAEPAAEPTTPVRIGPYRVISTLGHGGMGIVYLAEHEALGRRVALKVIGATAVHSAKARERFRREALAASRLDHPGICPIYEVGVSDGAPFLAMRHVPGRTLAAAIAESRRQSGRCVALPRPDGEGEIAAILHFGERAAAALHVAHEAGLVHRDVKPGNLMVTPTGEPVLLDFGLAQTRETDGDALTLTGDQLGTPAYMAPEQVSGGLVDRRTDVHALGAVLYECLTLRLPFEAANQHDLQSQILREEAPDPRPRHRSIGIDLWTVLQTALAKEPPRRYQTAAALAEDLRRVRMHEPILTRRATALLRVQRFVRRNPVAATFVGFLLLTLASFAVLLRQRGDALAETAAALRTARANEQALQSRDLGTMSPRLALEGALAAVAAEDNDDTVSVLHAALVRFRERAILRHGHAVWIAAFSPDGTKILTTSDDHTARIWDRDGHELARLQHAAAAWWATVDPTGKWIATTSADGSVVLWDWDGKRGRTVYQGEPLKGVGWMQACLEPDTCSVPWLAAFSPDGRQLAVTCSDRRARVFDVETGAQIGPAFPHPGVVMEAAWSKDSRWLATSEHMGEARLPFDRYEIAVWQPGVDGHREDARFSLPEGVMFVDFSPEGDALAAACRDGNAYVFDLRAPPAPARASPMKLEHRGPVWRARFSADGGRLLTCAFDGTVRLWSRDGTPLAKATQEGPVFDATFAAGDTRILTVARDNTARVFDADLRELVVLRGHTERTTMAALSPDGRQLLSASFDHTARIWDLADERVPRREVHAGRVRALARAPDGRIVSVGDDATMHVWRDREPAHAFAVAALPSSVIVDADGRTALVCSFDSGARRHRLDDGVVLAEYAEPQGLGLAAAFLTDGRVLTSGLGTERRAFREDGSSAAFGPGRRRTYALASAPGLKLVAGVGWGPNLTIWEEQGERHAHFAIDVTWPPDQVIIWSYAVAFSPDETRIVVGSGDGRARVFDLNDGRPIHPDKPMVLDGRDGRVLAVAWSPDGSLLATAGSDGAARLWNATTGEPLAVLRGHRGWVSAVTFTDDGRLLTGGDDGAVQAWMTSKTELLDLARRRLAK